MSSTLRQICKLVNNGEFRISDHGYDELAEDGILVGEVISALAEAQVVEDYPNYPKGPCVLVLLADSDRQPVHAVWGLPRGQDSPAVLVTAYKPDPKKWSDDFTRRR
jgi:hypothetical protein